MTRVTASTRVPLSPARAFDLFTTRVDAWWLPRYRRWPDSHLVFDASWLTERRGDVTHRVARITAWTPGHHLALELDGDPVEVRFEPIEDGSTQVTVVQTRAGDLTPFQDPASVRWADLLASLTWFAGQPARDPERDQ